MDATGIAVAQSPEGDLQHRASKTARQYAIGILFMVYMFNQIDRQIIAVLGQSIKTDLMLSDTQLGFLTGFAFAVFYSLTSIPIALIADRTNRRNLISGALALWSGMTAVCGLAQNFWQLAVARLFVGIGEAGCSPPAHSMISDMFKREERATALAVYGLGIPVGALGGLMVGGLLGEWLGWRSALFVIGAPGVVLAIVLRLTVAEPKRGASDTAIFDTQDTPTLRQTARYLWKRRSFRNMLAGGTIVTAISTSMVMWTPAFLERSFAMSLGEIGVLLGLVAGIPGAIGMFVGGYLSDRIGKHDQRWRLWVGAMSMILFCPFSCAAYLASSPKMALLLLTVPFFLNTMYAAASFAHAQSLVTIRMRSTAADIFLCVLALFGYGGGPQVVGILSDLLAPHAGIAALSYAMAIFSATSLFGALFFYRAGVFLEADLAVVGKDID